MLEVNRQPTIVLIHGLWFSGYILSVLARRLRRQGFIVHTFSYPSVRADLHANAARLACFLDTLDADTVHLVGHSLGGVLIRALFQDHPWRKPGRIVTLGAPHGGSRVAQHLSRHVFWRRAMGRGVKQLLSGISQQWTPPPREIGVICGTRSFGLGRLLYRGLPRPNDGLLTVKESAFPAADEHLALPVSHTGMMFSRTVARQIVAFLNAGRFDR
ncbi:MAG: alpha/beta fold hydrolase [Gammaproteobacteria bacterium]|nr:alpha/beta fold hydrolase [Gammaproteobacteria bacterium]